MVIILGVTALSCWIFFWIFLFYDMYLTHPELDMLARPVMVVAILLNIVGIILVILKLRKRRKWLNDALILALHILPLIIFGSFFYWLAFGCWL
jgi:hypothetical protein